MKLKQKLMAAILTVMMLTSYVAILTDAVIAVGNSLEQQSSKTNHTNVEFNSYFAEDKAVEETQNNQGALAID